MNGVHDLGGMHGFGPVEPEANEPVFHHAWEKTAFGMMVGTMAQGFYNVDEFRYGIELMDPVEYLGSSYYEHWLATIERNLVNKGLVSRAELEARIRDLSAHPDQPAPRRNDPAFAERVLNVVRGGGSTARDPVTPRFTVGDPVLTRNINPHGHTRLPRYARGKRGVVDRIHGTFVTPDTSALGQGENPQPVYGVRFTAQELWGEHAEPNELVYIDLWESYLEPA